MSEIDPLAGMRWMLPHEAPMRLSGFAWFAQDGVYRRLPKTGSNRLPKAVSDLANCTAGGQIRFQTDSKRVGVKVQLAGKAGMNHMPATGQCGFDLYIGPPQEQVFVSVTKYDHTQAHYDSLLLDSPVCEMHSFTLNFPLYQGVREVLVGIDADATVVEPHPYAISKPIAIYGTSITQGGCASRPGMAYTNILSRRLNVEVLNFGFSGNGRGEPEVAQALSTLPECSLFILDYEANSTAESLRSTLPRFLEILRAAHPETPILVVSRIRFARDKFHASSERARLSNLTFQQQCVEERSRQGDRHTYFSDGAPLLGDDFDECTVDGVHPTDLGFLRMANHLEGVIRPLLGIQ